MPFSEIDEKGKGGLRTTVVKERQMNPPKDYKMPGAHFMYEGEHIVIVEHGGGCQPKIKFLTGTFAGAYCQSEDSTRFIPWED